MKFLLIVICLLPIAVDAQHTCLGENVNQLFQANRIGASFSPQGKKFWPGSPQFSVPYTAENSPGTLFASSPWVGGYRDGELRIAAQSLMLEGWEYYTGPLLEGATTLGTECYRFNKIWSSNRKDILEHIQDYALDGMISDTIPSVFGWPGEGNSFFNQFNGFELPDGHRGGWANFSDNNQNGIYEPQLGEYPCVFLKNKKQIPEEIMWMVFNDQGPHTETGGMPIGVEIQLTVFAFNCQDNSILNNALFNTYKIINQNDVVVDSVFFGIWSDYDVGCSNDDFAGCDTLRNTEFAYNREVMDGAPGHQCITGLPTYGEFPPVQSMTYLTQKLSSFILAPISRFYSGPYPYPESNIPGQCYHLLNGKWRDGVPITEFEHGYNPLSAHPETKFLFPGDPRDISSWSQVNVDNAHGDPSTLSATYLKTLNPYDSVIVEMVYQFHQDSSLDHLEQIGFMQNQIDSLNQIIAGDQLPCTPFQYCEDESECVWPGDFNHNGISDHYDLLYWGVMKDQTGPARDGKINWKGHLADEWSLTLPDNINAKHGDGNGNAIINQEDLDRNIHHYLLTTPFYLPVDHYPIGPEIKITSDPMKEDGTISDIRIQMGTPVNNVLGLAYEFEFDTSLFRINYMRQLKYPSDSSIVSMFDDVYNPLNVDPYQYPKFGFVKTDHNVENLSEGFLLDWMFRGLTLKAGIVYDDIPDTVVLQLKNLIALDADGNDLHIGSAPLVIVKPKVVGSDEPLNPKTRVYPNPANDVIYVQVNAKTLLDVYTVDGVLVKQFDNAIPGETFEIADLPPGFYILKIIATGESIKLVVQ